MYEMTRWSGWADLNAAKSSGGQLSAKEQPRLQVRQKHQLIWVQNFGSFRHKVNPRKHNYIGFRRGSLLRQPQGIANIIRNILNVWLLIVMGQNNGIQVFF